MEHQLNAGDVAGVTTGLGVIMSFFTASLPVLQVIAVCVSIVTGCFASAYYYSKIRRRNKMKL